MNRLLIKKQAKASLKGKWGRAIGLCLVAAILTGVIPGIFYGIGTAFSTTKQTAEGIKITSTTATGAIFFIIAIIALAIISPLFQYAQSKAFLKANRGEDFTVGNVFDGFKEKPGKTFAVGILQFFVIWLCYFIPSFIGGIFLGIAGGRAQDMLKFGSMSTTEDVGYFAGRVGPLIIVAFAFFVAAMIIGIIATFMYQLVYYVRIDNPDMTVVQILKTSRKIMHGRKIDFFVLHFTFIGWAIVSCITCGIGFLWFVPYVQAATAAFYDDAKDQII